MSVESTGSELYSRRKVLTFSRFFLLLTLTYLVWWNNFAFVCMNLSFCYSVVKRLSTLKKTFIWPLRYVDFHENTSLRGLFSWDSRIVHDKKLKPYHQIFDSLFLVPYKGIQMIVTSPQRNYTRKG